MMRIAVIENGVVVNVILRDEPLKGEIDLPDDSPVSIGWAYDGTDFVPPPVEPVEPLPPDAVTVRLDQLEQRLNAIEAKLP